MMVYRYLNEQYALEALQTKTWKVGRLLELNDPADCQPILVNAPPQNTPEEETSFATRYLSGLYEDVGVVCFSNEITDPVIWSHYADSHRGIALGFDFDPGSGDTLHKVTYQDCRPTIDYQIAQGLRPEGQVTPAFIDKVIKYGFTYKAPSWAYEKEYRRFVWLGSPSITMKGAHYFEHFMTAPDRVVLGVRCRLTESDIVRAGGSYGCRFDRNNFCQAKLDRISYTLKV